MHLLFSHFLNKNQAVQIFLHCFFYGDFLGDLKKKYINSAALLLTASVLVKAISAVYKIPLTAYIGATGRGYFNMAYNLYMPVHAIIMGAFPVALTHLISKYRECGDKMQVARLKKASGIMFFAVGLFGTAFMIAAAVPYAKYMASPKCTVAVFALAPTVFFSSLASAKRAFAEGHMNMVPTSVSQILEAVFKLVFGLLFAKLSMSFLYSEYLKTGAVFGAKCADETQALSAIYPLTSAAAIAGVTVGSVISWAYLSAYVSVKYKALYPAAKSSVKGAAGEIASFGAPIIASALIQSLSEFADHSTVQISLGMCDLNALAAAYENCLMLSGTDKADVVAYVYGLFSAAHDLKNLVPGLTMALGVAAVPAISAAHASGGSERLSALLNSIFKYISLISFGGGFYLSLLSQEILTLLYQNSNYDIVLGCNNVVKLYGFITILFSLSGAAVFAVQSVGLASKSIPSFAAAGVLRALLNLRFVSDAAVNIYGNIAADAMAYAIILAANIFLLAKYAGVKFAVFRSLLMPGICCLASYFAANFIYGALFSGSGIISRFLLLGIIYALCAVLLTILSKTVSFSEIKSLANGKKTA